VALTVAVYARTLTGEFVYDDQYEIVQNHLIRHPDLYWTALTTDIWAFRGSTGTAHSNYWRPVVVVWKILNYELFGLRPLGWRLASLGAHLVVLGLAYRVLVRHGLAPPASALAVGIFALHPAQVETVAWPSAAPNILMAAFLLGAHVAYLRLRPNPGAARWLAVLALYSLALLSKEGAVVYPAIVLATEYFLGREQRASRRAALATAVSSALPFVFVAGVFLLLRYLVLGALRITWPGAPGLGSVLLTAPALLTLYLQHVVAPFELSPLYRLVALSPADCGWRNFALPLVIVLVALPAMCALACRRRAYALGLVWFAVPLVLALDFRVFNPYEIAKDRYLHLPLLGAVTVLSQGLADLAAVALRRGFNAARRVAVVVGVLCVAVLAASGYRYGPVWCSDVRLWERGVEAAPGNAYGHNQLGNACYQLGQLADARREFQHAMDLDPALVLAHLGLGAVDNRERRFAEAERHFRHVLEKLPDQEMALEQLALTYQQTGRVAQAIELFDRGRRKLPHKRGTYTVNIAVLYQLSGQPARARAELESIRDLLASAVEPGVLRGWFYLGELYRAGGDAARAVDAYAQFLARTRRTEEVSLRPLHAAAEQALSILPRPSP
jgi:tetratricopeptide (TPR) repeat protein